jgi:hypothetical protein
LNINFITTNSKYKIVVNNIIDAIKIYLDNYTISSTCDKNSINVHFFLEEGYRKRTNWCGLNCLISHGVADKNWRNANKVSMFDYIFVSGDLWKKKYIQQGLPENKIIIGGYPKMDNIFNTKGISNTKYDIAWLPTHNAIQEVSSFPMLDNILDNLPKEWNIVKSIHPARKNDFKPSDNILLESNIIIADSGSTIYEAWSLGKPVILPDFLVRDGIMNLFKGSFEEYIYQNNIGYHANSFEDMKNKISIALNKGISQKEKDFIEGIFPTELRGNSGKVTAYLLNKIIERM